MPPALLHYASNMCLVCTTAFYTPGNLADAMMSFRNSSFGARPAAFVKGVRVRTKHLGYKKTVKKLSNMTAQQYKFRAEEYGREVTVAEYFKLSEFSPSGMSMSMQFSNLRF